MHMGNIRRSTIVLQTGNTALMIAAEAGHVHIVDMLLKSGSNLNDKTDVRINLVGFVYYIHHTS